MPLLLLFFYWWNQSLNCEGFFLPIRKKLLEILACIQILFKLETNFQSKKKCFVLFRFFSLWIWFCFLIFFKFYFIIILFLLGREVFLSIACPRLLIPSIFDKFLWNYISVKEIQLKCMQRKISDVYVFVIECILHRELIMNGKKFLKDIYDQKC